MHRALIHFSRVSLAKYTLSPRVTVFSDDVQIIATQSENQANDGISTQILPSDTCVLKKYSQLSRVQKNNFGQND